MNPHDVAQMDPFYAELRSYVGFGRADERALSRVGPFLEPAFPSLVDAFYERVQEHPGAARVMTGGPAQIERLKTSLCEFLRVFFSGPWDSDYFEKRSRIGRRHVLVGLDQHYMVTGISTLRSSLCDALGRDAGPALTPEELNTAQTAVRKLFDIELAVMLRTYQEDHERRLKTAERLSTFGELTSTICHELRNPLGVIESSVFILRRREQDPHRAVHLDRIERQVRRSTRIIQNMLDIVREGPVNVGRVDPRELCARAARNVQEERDARVEVDVAEDIPEILADPELALLILGNLLNNAVDATRERPAHTAPPRVRLSVHIDGDPARVRFLVEDNGPGIASDVRDRLFEPLVTSKQDGVGLGLALSQKLARQLQGTLAVCNHGTLSGASFCLSLPFVTPV